MPSKQISSEQNTSEETRTSEEKDYEADFEGQQKNSVYDFLYQDVRRVASFLAQFEEHGVRQSVKATESVGRAQAVKGGAQGTLGLPTVMGASAIVDVTTTDDTKDLAEHTFDPLWSNSRRLLDYLTEHDLICEKLWEARAGQFALVKGSISIIDTALLNEMFSDAVLREAFENSVLEDQGLERGTPAANEIIQNVSVATRLPKTINLFVFSDEAPAWATLSDDSLVARPHDIGYKHGALVRGRWNVLGIIDAFPDFKDDPTEENPDPKFLDEAGEAIIPDSLIKVAAKFTNVARSVLGRPRSYFGITPLLIFREVHGRDVI